MCHRDGPTPPDLTLYDDLAGCFETAALVAVDVAQCPGQYATDREALELAVSISPPRLSRRFAVPFQAMNGDTDEDQFKIYSWLRRPPPKSKS